MSDLCGERNNSSYEVLQAEGSLSVGASELQLQEVTGAIQGGREVARRERESLYKPPAIIEKLGEYLSTHAFFQSEIESSFNMFIFGIYFFCLFFLLWKNAVKKKKVQPHGAHQNY